MLFNLDQDPHKSDNVAPNKIGETILFWLTPRDRIAGKAKELPSSNETTPLR
jgi:hypothetical protein